MSVTLERLDELAQYCRDEDMTPLYVERGFAELAEICEEVKGYRMNDVSELFAIASVAHRHGWQGYSAEQMSMAQWLDQRLTDLDLIYQNWPEMREALAAEKKLLETTEKC